MEIKNNTIEVEIEKSVYGGRGLGRCEGRVVFVEGGIPGDRVKALIKKKKANFIEAEVSEILVSSPDRIEPPCPVFGKCGGCTWQNLSYNAQMKCKEDIALSSLEHISKIKTILSEPIVPSPDIWRYRNKMDFTFGSDENGEATIGMHKKGNFYEIVDIEKCLICPESFEKILRIVKLFCREHKLVSYNPRNHQGLLRHLIIREGRNTGELIAVLLTSSENFPDPDKLVEKIKSEVPSLTAFSWGINSGMSDAPNIDKINYQYGQDYFFEKIGHIKLQVSPFSFMQTNTKAAENLYNIVKEYVESGDKDILFDAYCGAGSIGLYVSSSGNQVFGIDIVLSAIWDARRNAKLNGINNAVFMAGEMKKSIPLMLTAANNRITRIIVDPPRSGMDKKSLKYIIEINAPMIVYVSCNPTTLARDVEVLAESGYVPVKARPVDLFPHTYHIEMVIQFKKKELL